MICTLSGAHWQQATNIQPCGALTSFGKIEINASNNNSSSSSSFFVYCYYHYYYHSVIILDVLESPWFKPRAIKGSLFLNLE